MFFFPYCIDFYNVQGGPNRNVSVRCKTHSTIYFIKCTVLPGILWKFEIVQSSKQIKMLEYSFLSAFTVNVFTSF